jgi:hypothetical protein
MRSFRFILSGLLAILALIGIASAQNVSPASEKLWSEIRLKERARIRYKLPKNYRLFILDSVGLYTALKDTAAMIKLPEPRKGCKSFRVNSSAVMDTALARKYPELGTYEGNSPEDSTSSVRMERQHLTFRFMVTGPRTYYIEPVKIGRNTRYICFFPEDWPEGKKTFEIK